MIDRTVAAFRDGWVTAMMPNYGVPPLAVTHGRGCVIVDVEGREYLDLIAGIATSSLGHAHPALVEAVTTQVGKLAHTSNLLMHEPGLALAERLRALLGPAGADARVFFCQDGAGANEAAYKLARIHGWRRDATGAKQRIVAAEGSFHGRTLGALSVTGSPGKRQPFEPLPGPVDFVPYGDLDALARVVGPQTSAVYLEPIQGEAGVVMPPAGYLGLARELCDRYDALLVVDEVQSGLGRTGEWFASMAAGVRPDVMTLAKGLAGGLPLGCCIGFGAAAELFGPGDHGSTFGGNPVSCAAALAVIDTIENEDLLSSVREIGSRWQVGFNGIHHELLLGSRGVGAWWALLLAGSSAGLFEAVARDEGFLVNGLGSDVVRLAPPLVLTSDEAGRFLTALPGLLDRVAERSV